MKGWRPFGEQDTYRSGSQRGHQRKRSSQNESTSFNQDPVFKAHAKKLLFNLEMRRKSDRNTLKATAGQASPCWKAAAASPAFGTGLVPVRKAPRPSHPAWVCGAPRSTPALASDGSVAGPAALPGRTVPKCHSCTHVWPRVTCVSHSVWFTAAHVGTVTSVGTPSGPSSGTGRGTLVFCREGRQPEPGLKS